jgi:hypothetical protein
MASVGQVSVDVVLNFPEELAKAKAALLRACIDSATRDHGENARSFAHAYGMLVDSEREPQRWGESAAPSA